MRLLRFWGWQQPVSAFGRRRQNRVRSLRRSYYHAGKTQGQRDDKKMKKSLTRIRTSHVGRLPPPKGWEDMPARLANAELTDPAAIAAEVTPAIAETVKKQVEAGI